MFTSVISRGWRRLVIAAIGVALLFALVPSTAFAALPSPTYGWNIGNTMEPPTGEGTWNNPAVTQSLINAVKAAGFNTIRIPIAWNSHANQSTYVIDAAWMARVKQVVDYCYANNLHVIINSHWDNGWLDTSIDGSVNSTINAKVQSYWTQIANTFKNYDDKLYFACTNEPAADTAAEMSELLTYYQTFVNAVRATGGNNTSRWLLIQGPCTDIDLTYSLMNTLPTDPTSGRLMVEVHYYSPYNFVMMTADESWGNQFYYWGANYHSTTDTAHNPTWGEESYTTAQFEKMRTKFVNQGIPVIVGEFGGFKRTSSNPAMSSDNFNLHVAARTYYHKNVVDTANSKGLKPCFWDNGWTGDKPCAVFDRNTCAVFDSAMKTVLTGGAALPPPGSGGSAPSAPSNLTATAVSSSQINLSWSDNSSNETGFKIERSTSSTSGFSQIGTTGANTTSYQSTGLSASTTYYYRVRATNSYGDSSYSNTASATTQSGGGTVPAAPSNLSASAVSSSQINLSWTDNANNESGFYIERKTGSGGTYSQIASVGANTTSYSNTGLSASTTYYYRVRAYNAAGNSGYSNEANATTQASGGGGTEPVLGTWYKVIARHSGKALDVNGASTSDGANVIQWSYGGGNNQQWRLVDIGSGRRRIEVRHSGKVLTVYNNGSANGTNVEQRTYSSTRYGQQWTLTATDSGNYRLTPRCATSAALDVNGSSTADGANVQIWAYGGGQNQQWSFQTP